MQPTKTIEKKAPAGGGKRSRGRPPKKAVGGKKGKKSKKDESDESGDEADAAEVLSPTLPFALYVDLLLLQDLGSDENIDEGGDESD